MRLITHTTTTTLLPCPLPRMLRLLYKQAREGPLLTVLAPNARPRHIAASALSHPAPLCTSPACLCPASFPLPALSNAALTACPPPSCPSHPSTTPIALCATAPSACTSPPSSSRPSPTSPACPGTRDAMEGACTSGVGVRKVHQPGVR